MTAQPFDVQLSQAAGKRALLALVGTNLFFTFTTAAFIVLWSKFETLGPTERWLTRHVLVQGHLATENVLAATYSSLLLLAVAALSLVAFKADPTDRWRGGWLVLAAIFALLSLDELGSLHERVGMIRALSPWDAPAGWFYVLAIPIAAIATFMGLFALVHFRRARGMAVLMAAGIVLFLLNPVLEAIEMRLIHGPGARPGTWQRNLHDLLLVLEEGGLELFGVLCFLAAVAVYVRRTAPDGVELVTSPAQRSIALVVLAAGAWLGPAVVDALPAGDSGLPQNWFPAVVWAAVAAVVVRVNRWLAAIPLAISLTIGSGLYVYSAWMTSSAAWVVPVGTVLLGGATLEAALWCYRFRRSPTSLIASPSLRRPRPNPS